jgi:hypothetical protein
MDLKTLSRNAGTAAKRLLFDPEQVSKPDPPEFKLSLNVDGIQWGLSPFQSFSFLLHRVWACGKRSECAAIQRGRFGS